MLWENVLACILVPVGLDLMDEEKAAASHKNN